MSRPRASLGEMLGGIAIVALSMTLYPWDLRQILPGSGLAGYRRAILFVHGSLFILSLQCFYWGFVVPLIRSWQDRMETTLDKLPRSQRPS